LRLASTPTDAVQAVIEAFGKAAQRDGWVTLSGVSVERIPDLVAALVHAGARIQALEQNRNTLEERFLEVLEEDA